MNMPDFLELPVKKRQTIVLLVIGFFWLRTVVLNVIFQTDVEQVASTTGGLFRSATFYGALNLIILFSLWYWSKGNLKMLGWQRDGFWRHLGIGALFGLGMIIQSYFVSQPLIGLFVSPTASQGVDMSVLLSDWSDLPFWILLAIFKGGFEEELWRSFEINAFKRMFGKAGLIFGLLAGALFFGLAHSYQGLDSVISTGFDGVLYGLIYLRRRSVVEAMTAHAVYDIISIVAGYLIY